MKVGYVRVSTAEQNTARQEVLMEQLGVEKVYIDKVSGKWEDGQKNSISTPTGRFMLTVFAAVAELERGYLLDRQKEGIAVAKLQGKYKGRKPIAVDEQLWAELFPIWKKGVISATEFMRRMGLSKGTFYRKVNNF